MDKKDIGMVKRAIGSDSPVIDKIYTCYCGGNGNVHAINTDRVSTALLTEECESAYRKIFKSALTGKQGKKLYSLEFAERYETGKEQELLGRVYRHDGESEAVEELFDKIMENYVFTCDVLIIVAKGIMDLPAQNDEDDSENVYEFMLCCICNAESIKDGLKYERSEDAFVDAGNDCIVRKPEIGFLYPCLTDGMSGNIGEVLYYARKEDELHKEVITGVLGCGVPLPEGEQRTAFQKIVEDSLGSDCTVENITAVYDAVNCYESDHRNMDGKDTEIGAKDLKRYLVDKNVPEESAEAFEEEIRQAAEDGVTFNSSNISDNIVMSSAYATIKIKREYADMVISKRFGGVEYIMIPAEGMDVNGIFPKAGK